MVFSKLGRTGSMALVIIIIVIISLSLVAAMYNAQSSQQQKQTVSTPSTSVNGSDGTISSSSSSSSLTSTTTTSNTARIVLPLYASPSQQAEWNQVISSTPTTGMLVINPDFGPGYSQNSGYVSIIQQAQQKGIDVLGYVSTSYANGGVSIASAENSISDWYTWYHVDGIFFDEVNSTCSYPAMNYYSTLYNYTKSQLGPDIVVLNPGSPAQSCYALYSDILVTFEGDYSVYLNNYLNESWTLSYPASHFLQIIYNATTLSQMQEAVRLSSQRHAAWVFVTDRQAIGVNALGRLPYYFCQEVETINSSNTGCISINGTMTTSSSSANQAP